MLSSQGLLGSMVGAGVSRCTPGLLAPLLQTPPAIVCVVSLPHSRFIPPEHIYTLLYYCVQHRKKYSPFIRKIFNLNAFLIHEVQT